MEQFTPKQIVKELDRFIIGQNSAKKAVAIALRNRYRRSMLPEELKEEITPKNIIMQGPTGVGKTDDKGERFGEYSEKFDGRHEGQWHLQPCRNIRPENLFPILFGSPNIDGKERADAQYDSDCDVARRGSSSREDRNKSHQVVDQNEKERGQQIGRIAFVTLSDTRFYQSVIDLHDEHFHRSDKSFRNSFGAFPVPPGDT